MEDFKWSDMHVPLAALNSGMIAVGAIEGDPGMMAFNGGLLALNGGLAVNGRKDDFRRAGEKAPRKGLAAFYDGVLSNRVAETVEGVASDGDYGSRRL